MFPRSWRLTRSKDVARVYRQGESGATRFLFVRCLPNKLNQTRFAVAISKKISKKAVARNRLKRLVRQAVYEMGQVPSVTSRVAGCDCVITVHCDPGEPYTMEKIKPEVEKCLERLPSR